MTKIKNEGFVSERIYQKDGYRREIRATLLEKRGNGLVFDRTIFYPECGGQRGDKGLIDNIPVLDTQKDRDDEALHLVADPSSFEIGREYTLSLDWHERYKYMKVHTAQHLLSALLFHELGAGTLSVHQGDRVLTIETDRSELSEEELLHIEDRANEEVRRGRAVTQREMSRIAAESLNMRRSIKVSSPAVLVVFIEGLDAVACGGVHVASTSELGEIVFLGSERIRSHIRTIWAVGEEAVRLRRENSEIIASLSVRLSAERSLIPSAVNKLCDTLLERERQYNEVARELALYQMRERGRVFETELPLDAFIPNLKEGEERFIVSSGEKRDFLYLGSRERFLALKSALELRGGGRPPLFRGMLSLWDEERKQIVQAILA